MTVFAVGFGDLLEVVWVAFVAGVGVTAIFAGIVYFVARSGECRREGLRGKATLMLGAAGLLGLVFASALAYGLRIIAS